MTVLTIDVGTSSIRVSAVSLTGEIIARASSHARSEVTGDAAVLDAGAAWAELCRLTSEVVSRAGQPDAVGVAAQLGMVLLDSGHAPVALAWPWQDVRAAAEAQELDSRLGERAARIAGRPLAPELLAPRLRWIERNAAAELARARWVVSLKDFVVAQLTGEIVTDPTSASYTGLFDVSRCEWSVEMAAAAGISESQLPPVLSAESRAGAVTTRAAVDSGLGAGTVVAVGGPDGSVGALGSGVTGPDQTVDIAGTTDVLLHSLSEPLVDPKRRAVLNAYLIPALWTVGGPTGMTGGAVSWLSSLLGFSSVDAAYARLGVAASSLPPGADGVSFHTALGGERFPRWDSGASARIVGLQVSHGPEHLLRAAEEGAAFALREGFEALAELGVVVGDVRISGGVSRRRETMQMRASAWGRAVVPVAGSNATTLGAAVLASVAGECHQDVATAAAEMVSSSLAIEPEPRAAEAYDVVYESWQAARAGADRTRPEVLA